MARLSSLVGEYEKNASIIDSRQYVAESGRTQYPLFYVEGAEEVYVNGVRLYSGASMDYTTPKGIIQLNRPSTAGDKILLIGRAAIQEFVQTNQVEDVRIFNTVTDMIEGTDSYEGQKIQTLGYLYVGDGRSGSYFYSETTPKSSAEGFLYVDTSVPLGNQGTGVGNGVWILQIGGIAEALDEALGALYDGV